MVRSLVLLGAVASFLVIVSAQFGYDYSLSYSVPFSLDEQRPCVYQGEFYMHGTKWSPHPCSKCRCNNLNVECEMKTCPVCKGKARRPTSRECCGKCDRKKVYPTETRFCVWKGKAYVDGEKFPLNDCTDCICKDGTSHCEVRGCMQPPCRKSTLLPGRCCPECLG